jgi:hypothetical protein
MILKKIRAFLARSISIFVIVKLTLIAKYSLIAFSALRFFEASLKPINWFTFYNDI